MGYSEAGRLDETAGACAIEKVLRAAQAIPAIQALVAGAVADGDMAALVAEGGVPHHAGELNIEG
jgi:hypothetical protein